MTSDSDVQLDPLDALADLARIELTEHSIDSVMTKVSELGSARFHVLTRCR